MGTLSHRSTPERDSDEGSGARTVRRRRGLPGSRAVVGGLLVALAAVGLFAAASGSADRPRQSFVVARQELPVGTRLQPSDLALVPMDLGPAQRARSFRSTEPLLDATLIAALGPGELVQSSAVVVRKADTASRELSFTLERGRVGTGIKHGERVDLLATYGTGNDAFTVVVVRQALLVAVDRTQSSSGSNGPATVTVAVEDPADALALGHAIQLGKITLVRATGAPPLAGVLPTYRSGQS